MIFNDDPKGAFQKKWNKSSPLWITRKVLFLQLKFTCKSSEGTVGHMNFFPSHLKVHLNSTFYIKSVLK